MFKVLEKKIINIILLTVGLLLILLNIGVYMIISSVIREDFLSKSLSFAKQTANSFDIQLNHIESSIRLLISCVEYNVNVASSLHNEISDVRKYNVNILGGFFINDRGNYYVSHSYYYNVAKFIHSNIEIPSGGAWYIIRDNSNQSLFLYLIPIEFSSENITGIMGVDLSYRGIFGKVINEGIFLKDASISIMCGDEVLSLNGDLTHNIEYLTTNTAEFDKDGSVLFKNYKEGAEYSMIFRIPFNSVETKLFIIKLLFVLIWLITVTLCYLTVKMFCKNLSSMLMNLNQKIIAFIKTLE